MFRKLLFLIVMMLTVMVSGCALRGVEDATVIEDVIATFQNESQQVENVEILESEKEEGTQNVYVSFEIRDPVYTGKRYYHLLYNYYDRGGWMMDQIQPYLEEKWYSEPVAAYHPQEDIIAYELFQNLNAKNKNERGFVFRSEVEDVFFRLWTSMADSVDRNPADYIKEIEYSDSLEENLCYTLVTVEAQSHALKIQETIKLTYEFSESSTCWLLKDKRSVGHKLDTVRSLEGSYLCSYPDGDRYVFTISEVSEEGYIKGISEEFGMMFGEPYHRKHEYEYCVNSVSTAACDCYKYHHSSHNTTSKLTFNKDYFNTGLTGVAGTTYKYATKQ